MTILFLCVANSARSQMAEGLAQRMAPDLEIWSAGSEPARVKPAAVAALAEVGIDGTELFSKGIDEVPTDRIDTVITLCAEEYCPAVLLDRRRLHWPIPDPHDMAGFRRARDEIGERLEAFFAEEGVV